MPRFATLVILCLWASTSACDGGAADKRRAEADAKKAADEAAEKEAAEAATLAAAKRKAEQAAEDKRAEEAYQAAKPSLEPLAKLPKKRPKGFANACIEMLAEYDPFVKASLEGDALAKWEGDRDNRVRVMRRACHQRPVDVVVCETAVLKKAPAGSDFGHIKRVCYEKFSGA